jgi:hypothetical protein
MSKAKNHKDLMPKASHSTIQEKQDANTFKH